MLELLAVSDTEFVVVTEDGSITIPYVALPVEQLQGLTPHQAFCKGIAYSLLCNRGQPHPTEPAEIDLPFIHEAATTEEI